MTTYKHCKKCGKIVKFAPLDPVNLPYARVYYPNCIGGNDVLLCGATMNTNTTEAQDSE